MLDTRGPGRTIDDEGNLQRRIGPGETLALRVLGRGQVPAAGVDAVVLNVTAIRPTADTHLTVYPAGATAPTASNLNVARGAVIPNLVVSKVGANGSVHVFNAFGTSDVVIDLTGYFPASDSFEPLVPARLLDTRPHQPDLDGLGRPGRPLGPRESIDVPVLGRGGVPPTGVAAVVLNVTAITPTATSHLTVYPTGSPLPNASNLNLVPGVTRPNLVLATIGSSGSISIYNEAGDAHVAADIAGYFPDNGSFQPLEPMRLFETRAGRPVVSGGVNYGVRLGAAQSIDIDVTSVPGVNGSAAAVVLNVTAISPSEASHLTLWPVGVDMPNASNLNLVPGTTAPNLVVVKVGAGGNVSLYNHAGTVDLAIDIAGYFLAEPAPLRDVATSDGSTCVVDWVGEAACWGYTPQDSSLYYDGVDNSPGPSPLRAPYVLGVFDDIVQIGVAWGHACVLRDDGSVWCWGANYWGVVGNGISDGEFPPKKVTALEGVVEISVGYLQACAVRSDGTVWCWGKDFTNTPQPSARRIAGISDAVHVSVGAYAACVVRANGTVWCWGQNGDTGVLGDGSGTDSPVPRPVIGLTDADWVEVSGLRACATRTSGEAACWGNSFLGGGANERSLSPVDVIDGTTGLPADDIIQIDGGDDYSCVLRADAQVYCWGSDSSGTLGLTPDPNLNTTWITTPVPGLPDIAAIFADRFHICAVSFDDELYCWGSNTSGQLGIG
jgi:hypothetical protein